jgi:hypothetical protein
MHVRSLLYVVVIVSLCFAVADGQNTATKPKPQSFMSDQITLLHWDRLLPDSDVDTLRARFLKTRQFTEVVQASVYYYRWAGMSFPPQAVEQSFWALFPEYPRGKDEFTRRRFVERTMIPKAKRWVEEYGGGREFYIICQIGLGEYIFESDFNGHTIGGGFPFQAQVQQKGWKAVIPPCRTVNNKWVQFEPEDVPTLRGAPPIGGIVSCDEVTAQKFVDEFPSRQVLIYLVFSLKEEKPRPGDESVHALLQYYIVASLKGEVLCAYEEFRSGEMKVPVSTVPTGLDKMHTIWASGKCNVLLARADGNVEPVDIPLVGGEINCKGSALFERLNVVFPISNNEVVRFKKPLLRHTSKETQANAGVQPPDRAAQARPYLWLEGNESLEPTGGWSQWLRNLKYPDDAVKGLPGAVEWHAFFNEDGRLDSVFVKKDICLGCGDAVEKALRLTEFNPIKRNGVPIRFQVNGRTEFPARR